jgi:signal transduction histidine kinase
LFRGSLKTKFLLSLALISALLTFATLLIVRLRVELHVRDEISQGLRNSVSTFLTLEQAREAALERSAALLAVLPPLKAVMTSQHKPTIQDASGTFWALAGSQLFVLTDGSGAIMALHTSTPGFTEAEAQQAMPRSVPAGGSRGWWFSNGRLFEVFVKPIYFGGPDDDTPLGMLAVGYEIDSSVAAGVGRAASGRVAFQYGGKLAVTTVPESQRADLSGQIARLAPGAASPVEVDLGREKFLATSVSLASSGSPPVALTVLKSYDEATAFLSSLNRWILAIGVAAVLLGSALVFLVSTTFTRPLDELVAGVNALEKGDFGYPIEGRGSDEVSILSAAFRRMRIRLQDTQRQLIESERLATIGRMSSMISHDLRHPLTAILAYSEFLSECNLSDAQRKDFFEEIRIAVNHMTDELNSLLGFSKQGEAIRPAYGRLEDAIQRAVETVKVLPEHERIQISFIAEGEDLAGWFDFGKLERAVVNLLFNACEAVPGEGGTIEVRCRRAGDNFDIIVADNGPGIPETIRENLFHPFVSSGKPKGIGLGLTVVQKIVQDHGGSISVDSSGPSGTVFRISLPSQTPHETPARV